MNLNEDQRNDIRNFLLSRGLAFKPLLDEMSDHVECDLENKMNEGLTYEEAWRKTIEELPEDHFRQIQKETMETINTRFTLSRIFTYVGMVALLAATIFKLLHLRGAEELVVVSLAVLAISLITGSISGIYVNRDKNGALRVMGIVAGVVLLEAGYVMKLLHLPGADQLILISIATLLVTLTINTIYVYNNGSGKSNLFTFLHAKYSPGIERFMLILLPFTFFAPGTGLISVIEIFTASLQIMALVWTTIEKDPSKKNSTNLILAITVFTCVMVPMLGHMVDFNIRLLMVTVFSFAGAWMFFRLEPSVKPSSYLICVAPVMFLFIALMKLGLMQSFAGNWPLNIIVMLLMVVSIFLSEKGSIGRTYMILSLSGYYLEIITTKY